MRAEVVHTENVRVVQRAGGARLLLEPPQPLGIGRERGGKHLDGDLASETRVVGTIDLAHAAGAERSDDFVRAETRSGSQAHVRGLCHRSALTMASAIKPALQAA